MTCLFYEIYFHRVHDHFQDGNDGKRYENKQKIMSYERAGSVRLIKSI